MATGKNKLLRFLRLYAGGYDLSGDSRTFSVLDNNFADVDLTVWNNTVKKYLPDQMRRTGIRGYQALLNDTTDSGAWVVLKSPYADPIQVSMAFGGGGEPANGDPAYFLNAVQMQDRGQILTGAAVINANFLPSEIYMANQNPLGHVLQGAGTISTTSSSASIDNGAGTTNGFHSNLHVLATGGGASFTLEIEHSINNSDWSQLALFAADGASIESEYAYGTGTVNRYVRFTATRSNGTCSVVCVFSRG